jgi:hypothetical protein
MEKDISFKHQKNAYAAIAIIIAVELKQELLCMKRVI